MGGERVKGVRGSDHKCAKLSDQDVKLILDCAEERELINLKIEKLKKDAESLSSKNLAKKFGVSYRHINKIISGSRWGHM